MKTALITGGLGFIGTHIAIDLLKNKKVKKCILLDNFGGYMNPTKENFYDWTHTNFAGAKRYTNYFVEVIMGGKSDFEGGEIKKIDLSHIKK